MSKNTLLAFIHIEKTAGTALNQYLTRSLFGFHPCLSFEFSDSDERDQNYMRASELAIIRRLYPFLKGIGGHSLRSDAGYGDESLSVRYFTFVRDPVKRVLSQFHHHREVMNVDWSFEKFLDHGDYNNLMCRRICGQANAEVAIAELKKRFYFVGLIERFEESLQHFRTLSNGLGYSFKNIEIGSKNVRAKRDNDPFALSENMIERIKILNAEDIKLFDFVLKYGPTIDGAVKWGDTQPDDKSVVQYQTKDYVIGWLNRVLSVVYCRRLEYLVRNRNSSKLIR